MPDDFQRYVDANEALIEAIERLRQGRGGLREAASILAQAVDPPFKRPTLAYARPAPEAIRASLKSVEAMADELAKDHKAIWLQPRCCVDERAWCETDPGPCEDCGMPSIKYVRANEQATTAKEG